MVSPGLRELVERGAGAGDLDGPGVRIAVAEHPVCGDRVQLSVQVVDGKLRAVRWRASGCPASMAVAALAAHVLVDVPVADATERLRDELARRGGLARHERHAEAMVLRALGEALGG